MRSQGLGFRFGGSVSALGFGVLGFGPLLRLESQRDEVNRFITRITGVILWRVELRIKHDY